MHDLYCKPADAKGILEVETEELKSLSRAKMHKTYNDLVTLFLKKGKYLNSGKQIKLTGPEYLESGKRLRIYGGGSWFNISGNKIWYVQNNGSDGGDWSHNNIATGGAGAVGVYLPYTESMAQEIRLLDKLYKP